MVFNVTMVTLRMTLLWISEQTLSWMIEFWMKTTWQVIVIATLYIYNHPENLQGMTNNVGFRFSVGDMIPQFTISIEQDN